TGLIDDANLVSSEAARVARLAFYRGAGVGENTGTPNTIGGEKGENARAAQRNITAEYEIGEIAGRVEQDVAVVRDRAGKSRAGRVIKLHQARTGELDAIGYGKIASELENSVARGR